MKQMRSLMLFGMFMFLALLPAQQSEEVACPPDKAPDAQIISLKSQLDDLRSAVNDREQKLALLKLMVSQKDAQIQFYVACMSAGLMPDDTCHLDLAALTVTKVETRSGLKQEKGR